MIKMAWIEPLELQTIVFNILSEKSEIFTSIALISIFGLAAYFRMNALVMMFMLGLFLIMFSQLGVYQPLYFIVLAIGSVLIGYWISKLVKN